MKKRSNLPGLMAFLTLSVITNLVLIAPAFAADVPPGVKLAAKQELTLNNGGEVSSLDPHKMAAEPAFELGKDLFEGLVSQDKKGRLTPGMALRWETSNENKTHTFYLRKDAKWSNGDPITAHDFVFSFQRIMTPATASPYGWFAEIPQIKNSSAILKGEKKPETLGVKALDDYTLEFTLEESVPYFSKLLSHPVMSPVHKATVEKFGESWTRPENMVCNGPFKLVKWSVNEKMVLAKNKNYWNADKVVLEKLTWLPIGDPNVALKRYQAGEIDVIQSIPTEQMARLEKARPNEFSKEHPNLHSVFYYLNTTMAPTDDIRVRKALAYAIDREILTKHVTGNGELPHFGLTPPNVDGFDPKVPEYASMSQSSREDEARKLLKEAGYDKGNPLKFTMVIPSFKKDQKYSLALMGMWKKVLGAKIQMTKLEPKVFYATKDGYNVFRGGWVADYNEASSFLDLFVSTHGYNRAHFKKEAYDKLLASAKTSKDPTANYLRAEEILVTEFPIVPLYRPGYAKVLIKPNVGGYEMTNPERNYYRRDVYIIAK